MTLKRQTPITATSKSRMIKLPPPQNGAKNHDLRCVLRPSRKGAGCKTRLESRVKKFKPNFKQKDTNYCHENGSAGGGALWEECRPGTHLELFAVDGSRAIGVKQVKCLSDFMFLFLCQFGFSCRDQHALQVEQMPSGRTAASACSVQARTHELTFVCERGGDA